MEWMPVGMDRAGRALQAVPGILVSGTDAEHPIMIFAFKERAVLLWREKSKNGHLPCLNEKSVRHVRHWNLHRTSLRDPVTGVILVLADRKRSM